MNRPLLALSAFALLTACGTRPPIDIDAPVRLQSKANFYLRTGMDTDPSVYLGRFIPRGTPPDEIDEANAQRTECSSYFSVRQVGGGGVQLDEYFAATSQAAAALGISGSPGFGVQHGAVHIVRARYKFLAKWIAHLRDPAGFAECCAKADNNCSDKVIGEFIGGSGDLMQAAQSMSESDGRVPGAAQFDVRDGYTWRVAQTIPEPNPPGSPPVFFAFKLSPVRIVDPEPGAQDWCDKVPKVSHGMYFCGVSRWVNSEADARDMAMLHAHRQTVRHLGNLLRQGGSGSRQAQDRASAIDLVLQDQTRFQHASEGLVRFMKDENWKIEEEPGPQRWRYKAKVLAFIHKNEIEAATAVVERAGR